MFANKLLQISCVRTACFELLEQLYNKLLTTFVYPITVIAEFDWLNRIYKSRVPDAHHRYRAFLTDVTPAMLVYHEKRINIFFWNIM